MEIIIHWAKSQLSKLIEQVRLSARAIIAKVGKAPAGSVPIEPTSRREFGSAKGQITFREGWDAPMTREKLSDFLAE